MSPFIQLPCRPPWQTQCWTRDLGERETDAPSLPDTEELVSQARPWGECLAQTPGQRSLIWCVPLVNGPLCCPEEDPGLALPREAAETPGRPRHLTPYCAFPCRGRGGGARVEKPSQRRPLWYLCNRQGASHATSYTALHGIPFGVLMGFGAYIVPHQDPQKMYCNASDSILNHGVGALAHFTNRPAFVQGKFLDSGHPQITDFKGCGPEICPFSSLCGFDA